MFVRKILPKPRKRTNQLATPYPTAKSRYLPCEICHIIVLDTLQERLPGGLLLLQLTLSILLLLLFLHSLLLFRLLSLFPPVNSVRMSA
jgi:hypothetical protein